MISRPRVAITMGDAAGIGPEIIVKSLARAEVYDHCCPLVVGDALRLSEAVQRTGAPVEIQPVEQVSGAHFRAGSVDCVDLRLLPANVPFGKLSKACGAAAYRYIERAVELALSGTVDAICTAPINKAALQNAGYVYPGHTEILAKLTGTPEVSMMLVAENLRVIHVTTHIGLVAAVARIEPGLVFRTIKRGRETLLRSGIANPRIAVCGINPHAGEGGLFGSGEEEEKIVPAITAAHEQGWDVVGPLPADTLFFRARRGDFDIVVAMYHDQGHGPVKVLGLDEGVNITVGLPVIRTSVDHGTAFDIAGTGRADERSMLAAIKQAIELAPKPNAA
jgi:4-phospho-D-threonate 3-dehydrogenase / 4-phospho-D-erythronate 3-dehydrogenase